jgi:beta-lactamase regulating signal transducer with metallopeptidase domain
MISQLFTAGPYWTNPLFQSTVCITVGLIVSLVLRRRSARAHQVLFLAMIASVAVPTMSMIVRHYELGIFVDKPAVTKSQLAEIPILPLMTEYEISVVPAIQNTYSPPAIESEYAAPAAAVSSEAKAKLLLSAILIWSWITVSTILAARLFVTFILGLAMLKRAIPLHCDKLDQALLIAKDKLGIDKPVQVLAGSTVSSPVIWCWSRRPALLVPEDAEQFKDSVDWVGMFCHELAHWSRMDHITGLFAELMVCVFPWHPLMWWAKRRLAGLSEQACDDWVVAGSRSPADYADSLLDLSPQGQLSFLPAVVGRKNGLENRVQRIVKDKCGNPRLGLSWAVVVTLIAACIIIGAAFAQTRPADTEQTQECEELLTREKQQLLLEKEQLEPLAEEMKQQQPKQQKDLELLTARKELEQIAKELIVQQMQRDELMQYHTNLQQQVNNLYSELEALKKYQADKAKLHDQISATIKEINKIRQQIHTTAPEEPVGLDASQQTAQSDHLMQFKREIQAVKDRTRQQLDGLPKEVDKLRDNLKEIEDMIQSIDSRLNSPAVSPQQRPQSTDEYEAKRKELLPKRRELEERAKHIQYLLKEAPG